MASHHAFQCIVAFSMISTLAACNAQGSDGSAKNSASGNSASSDSAASAVTLVWAPPPPYTNGAPLPVADLAGFHIYDGANTAEFSNLIDVPATTSISSYTIGGLAPRSSYFAMAVYDSHGDESDGSNEVRKLLPPNQSTTVDISFDPRVAGTTAQLAISNNASANSTAKIGSIGTGVAAVAVTPTSASTTAGIKQQFAASVTGASNKAVTWAVSGIGCRGATCGTITSNGLYTAPATVPSSAMVIITATSVSDPTNSASATISIVPPQAAGYNLAWEDTFSTLNLCATNVPRCNWYNPSQWNFGAAGAITDSSGSYVNLNWRASQIYSTNMGTCSQNGIYCHAWRPPVYIEISMAFDPVTGSDPTLWLMPSYANLNSVETGPELDIFEWQSNTPTLGYGTVHAWVNGTDTGNNGSNNSWSIPAGTTLSNFNTYGILWTPTAVSWYFNNSLVETYSTTSAPFNAQFAGQYPMFPILSQFADCNWVWYQNSPCPGQVSPLNMQVQWVHIYSAPK